MWVAIDLGYGYVKAVAEDGKVVILRSVTSEGRKRDFKSVNGRNSLKPEKNLQLEVTLGGQSKNYYVGELAERFGVLPNYSMGKEHFQQESARILVWTVLALLSLDGKVNLAVGFPYNQYESLKDNFAQFIRSDSPTIQLAGKDPLHVDIGEVATYSQGWAAAYRALDTYEDLKLQDRYNAFVDIGHETTNVVVVEYFDGELFVHDELSTTLALGTSDLHEAVRKILAELTGEILDEDMIQRAIQNGKLFYDGDEVSIESSLIAAKQALAESIKDNLARLWGNKKSRIQTLFWAGGGPQILTKELKGFHRSEKTVNEAQLANAYGFLQAALDEFGKSKPTPHQTPVEANKKKESSNANPTKHQQQGQVPLSPSAGSKSDNPGKEEHIDHTKTNPPLSNNEGDGKPETGELFQQQQERVIEGSSDPAPPGNNQNGSTNLNPPPDTADHSANPEPVGTGATHALNQSPNPNRFSERRNAEWRK